MTPIRLLCAVPLLLCALAANAETRKFNFNVDTEVDASGVVIAADVLSEIDPAFEAALVRLMGEWKFRPATKNGSAVSIRTSMAIQVIAEIGEDQKARVTARYLSHGSQPVQITPPRYPADAMRSAGQAEIVLDVAFGADGRATSVEPFRSRVTRGSKKMAKLFEAAARDAVSTWRVHPEIVDGVPLASRRLIPIKFTIQNARSGKLVMTLDRSAEISEPALEEAAGRLESADPRGVLVGNGSGLELVSDGSSG